MLLKLIYTVSLIHVFLDPAFSERYRDLIEAADTISAMKREIVTVTGTTMMTKIKVFLFKEVLEVILQ